MNPNPTIDIAPPINSIRLSEIVSDNGSIEFIPKQVSRQDFKGIANTAYALEKIVIKDSNGSPYKVFKLTTSYFEANNDDKYPDNSSTYDNLNFRLRLDELQEYSGDELNSKKPYLFSYYGDDDPSTNDPYTLPCRLSFSQDHWGYFNDSNNSHIFPGNPQGKWIDIDPSLDFYTAQSCSPVKPVFGLGANRESNGEAMKAGTLNKITYPTGGSTSFVFEANQSAGTTSGFCGGLRINEIISDDGLIEVRRLKYEYGAGYLNDLNYDDYYSLFCIDWQGGTGYYPGSSLLSAFGIPAGAHQNQGSSVLITAQPLSILNGESGPVISYAVVTEYEEGNGKIIYSYTDPSSHHDLDDAGILFDGITVYDEHLTSQYIRGIKDNSIPYPDHVIDFYSSNTFPFPRPVSQEWRRGKLLQKMVYNESNDVIRKEAFTYHEDVRSFTYAYKFIPLNSQTYQEYHFVKYIVPANWIETESHRVIQYDLQGLNPVETITYYDYNSPNHVQISSERLEDGLGNPLKSQNYFYPPDYNSGLENISTLTDKNIIGIPIRVETITNGNLTQGIVSKYNDFGKPYENYSYETSSLISPPTHDVNVYIPSNYAIRINSIYESSNQQLVEYSPSDNISTSYIWALNNTYPIIKGENVSYSVLQSAVTSAIGQLAGYSTLDQLIEALIGKMHNDQGNLRAVWNDFNEYLRNESSLGNALITSYTYDPLIGMTSQTDANGLTTYYSYDELGRLQTVSDFEANPFVKSEYHYRE